jgi:hypothetical protein
MKSWVIMSARNTWGSLLYAASTRFIDLVDHLEYVSSTLFIIHILILDSLNSSPISSCPISDFDRRQGRDESSHDEPWKVMLIAQNSWLTTQASVAYHPFRTL